MNNRERIWYKDVLWRKYQGALIPDVVPHEEIRLSDSEARELIEEARAYFIRWTEDFDSKSVYPFWYVVKDEKEDLLKYRKGIP